MTLADLVAALERRAREAEAMQAHAPVAVVLRSVLEDLRTLEPEQASGGNGGTPRLLTAQEAAQLLGVTPRWLYDHVTSLPFAVKVSPRLRRFDEAGLRRWAEARRGRLW